jgi:DNA polymerase-3 subunit gamma/tau
MTEACNWLDKYRPVTFDDLWQQNVPGLKLLKTAVQHHKVPRLTICVGAYGVGKTSVARVLGRRFNCWNPVHAYNPCGECDSCRGLRPWEGGTFIRSGYLELDATELSPAKIVTIIRDHVMYCKLESQGTGCAYKPWVICIDELSRLNRPDVQERLIKLVENLRHGRYVLCFSDPAKIIEPLRERASMLSLPLPTSDEAVSGLIRIANAEGYALEPLVAKHIAESAHRVPRRCILALEHAALLSNSRTIDLDVAATSLAIAQG